VNAGAPGRPVPVPDDGSAPFWQAAADGVLVLARCSRCGTFAHPPESVCPHCHHTDPRFAFELVAGHGVIRSWTVIRRSFLPGFDDDLPFVLVDVALDGVSRDGVSGDGNVDVRLIGRLLDGPEAQLDVGAAVTVAFEELDGGVAVPAFALIVS
jgi:uncharacterized OB-fold protein